MGATKKAVNAKTPITITVRDLNDQTFYGALEKIDCSPVLKGDKAWAFADFKAICDDLHKKAEVAYRQLLFRSVETEPIMTSDEEGNTVPARDAKGVEIHRLKVLRDDNGRVRDYVFKDQTLFQDEMERLLSETITAQVIPLTSEEAAQIGLTPKELRAIRILIRDASPEPKLGEAEVYSS